MINIISLHDKYNLDAIHKEKQYIHNKDYGTFQNHITPIQT